MPDFFPSALLMLIFLLLIYRVGHVSLLSTIVRDNVKTSTVANILREPEKIILSVPVSSFIESRMILYSFNKHLTNTYNMDITTNITYSLLSRNLSFPEEERHIQLNINDCTLRAIKY